MAGGQGVLGQTYGMEPTDGTYELEVGFLPDPMVVEVEAGGGMAGISTIYSGLVDGVTGVACGAFYVGEAPTVRLNLAETSNGTRYPFLRLFVDVPKGSGVDAALLLMQPDGVWRCRDDSRLDGYVGLMPIVDLTDVPSGTYDVWVGTYDRGVSKPAALFITSYRTNVPTVSGY